MDDYPKNGLELFIHDCIREETDAHRLIDLALFQARLVNSSKEYAYALGVVSSFLSMSNARTK